MIMGTIITISWAESLCPPSSRPGAIVLTTQGDRRTKRKDNEKVMRKVQLRRLFKKSQAFSGPSLFAHSENRGIKTTPRALTTTLQITSGRVNATRKAS